MYTSEREALDARLLELDTKKVEQLAQPVIGVRRHLAADRLSQMTAGPIERPVGRHAGWVDGSGLVAGRVIGVVRGRPGDGLGQDPADTVKCPGRGDPAGGRARRVAGGVVRRRADDARRISDARLAIRLVVNVGPSSGDAGPGLGLGQDVAELDIGRGAGEGWDRGVARQALGKPAAHDVVRR
jgi:hypothetical protein